MRSYQLINIHRVFKTMVLFAACLLICSFLLRSIVVRPSETLHRIHSILSQANSFTQPEIDETQDEAPDSSPVPINQRTRNEVSTDNSLLITAIKLSGSILYNPTFYQRLEVSYSDSSLQSLFISPLEKPPKRNHHSI